MRERGPDPAAVDRQQRRVDQPGGQDPRHRHLRLGSQRGRARRGLCRRARSAPENVCTFDVGGTTTDVSFLRRRPGPDERASPRWAIGRSRIRRCTLTLVRARRRVDHRRRRRRGDPGRAPERRAPRPGRRASASAGTRADTDRRVAAARLPASRASSWAGAAGSMPHPPATRPTGSPAAVGRAASRRLLRRQGGDPATRCPSTCSRWAQRHPELTTLRRGRSLAALLRRRRRACCAPTPRTILGIDRVVVFPHSSVFSAFGAGPAADRPLLSPGRWPRAPAMAASAPQSRGSPTTPAAT